jgi:hypothetical protein
VGIFGSTGTYAPIAGVGVATALGVTGNGGVTAAGCAVGVAAATALGVTAAGCAVGVTVLTASVVLTVAVVTCVVGCAVGLVLVLDVQPATPTISIVRTPSIKNIFNVIFVILFHFLLILYVWYKRTHADTILMKIDEADLTVEPIQPITPQPVM